MADVGDIQDTSPPNPPMATLVCFPGIMVFSRRSSPRIVGRDCHPCLLSVSSTGGPDGRCAE